MVVRIFDNCSLYFSFAKRSFTDSNKINYIIEAKAFDYIEFSISLSQAQSFKILFHTNKNL